MKNIDFSQFHSQSLELLRENDIRLTSSPYPELTSWAKKLQINLPRAVLEWAKMDPKGEILSRFSNNDHFQWMKVDTLPDGRKGLFFHKENQGNFNVACLLDGGDNPPVIFLWYGGQYNEICLRFSDYIFTQIFDWQHKILFDENDYAIDLNYRQILLKSAQAINKLSRYRELPSNAWMAGDVKTHARRFQSDNKARATVQYLSNHGEIYLGGAECIIEITASNDQKSLSFESELLDLLTDFISAPIFYCPHHPKSMLRQLDSFISDNARSQIKHLCHTPIADEMVERIVEIGRHFSFENAVEARVRDTPEPPREEWIGGTKWGVRMKLVHIKNGWIRLDKIEVA